MSTSADGTSVALILTTITITTMAIPPPRGSNQTTKTTAIATTDIISPSKKRGNDKRKIRSWEGSSGVRYSSHVWMRRPPWLVVGAMAKWPCNVLSVVAPDNGGRMYYIIL
mmetsp:Transcript_530/g.1086  ORF Transcript_530/g.1086 Transcript_530/m.1086 type:complete len:111 (+) Transcript_530:877-1209(+)